MNTINEIIEILQAYQRNEEIEWESSRGIWEITTTPLWNFGMVRYRIKPQPYEYWLVSYPDNLGDNDQKFNIKPDKSLVYDGAIVRHMREVME